MQSHEGHPYLSFTQLLTMKKYKQQLIKQDQELTGVMDMKDPPKEQITETAQCLVKNLVYCHSREFCLHNSILIQQDMCSVDCNLLCSSHSLLF